MSDTPVALVTGGAAGIGAACSRALAEEGFRVAIHFRSSEGPAQELVEKLPDAFAVRADLASTDDLDALLAELKERAGRLDVLVNNAGVTKNAPMPAMKLEDYDEIAGIERGTWYLTKQVVRRFMLRQKSGRIINISSVVGHTGNRGQSAYTMAKAALDAMTKSLAQEVGGRGILVNSVAPGFIATDMTADMPPEVRDLILTRVPLGRAGTPEDVADVVAYLATRGSYIHGTVVHVNGGMYGG